LDIKTLEKEKIPHSKVEELEKECLSWQKESENDVSSLDDEKEIISKNILSNIHHYDVIIIGGGLTGLRAALQVSDAQLKVAIISKVHPLRSHSVAAQGGL
jgi:succinate dehydrogenase / fumarate reductase flavoprotein subunit